MSSSAFGHKSPERSARARKQQKTQEGLTDPKKEPWYKRLRSWAGQKIKDQKKRLKLFLFIAAIAALIWYGSAVGWFNSTKAPPDPPVPPSFNGSTIDDLATAITVNSGEFTWVPERWAEFTLNEKTKQYEPEWIPGPVFPPHLRQLQYEVSPEVPFGCSLWIRDSLAETGKAFQYSHKKIFFVDTAAPSYFKLQRDFNDKPPAKVLFSIKVRKTVQTDDRRPLHYLLGEGKVTSHTPVTITLSSQGDVRDICLSVSKTAVFSNREFTYLEDDKNGTTQVKTLSLPALAIPQRGFPITMKYTPNQNETWERELNNHRFETAVHQGIKVRAEWLLSDAEKISQAKLPFERLPFGATYYQVEGQPACILTEGVVCLSGRGLAGKKIRIGINLPALPEPMVLSPEKQTPNPVHLESGVVISVVVTAYQW